MSDSEQYYGLLCNSSINIGDEIQSVAAMRFLPKIDKYVHRERIDKYKSNKKTKLIMNAWWTQRISAFPPSDDIEPLLISMHFRRLIRNSTPPQYLNYLKQWGPVGCRDKATAEWLNQNGVPAYFSGCLTLTLQKNPLIKKGNYILGVDLPKHIVKEIKSRTDMPFYNISRKLMPLETDKRFKLAQLMLYIYQSARCIVTSRLHVAMPSLALETPVLMLDTKDDWLRQDGRYEGLAELCNTIKEDDFISNKDIYDFSNPPANPDKYKELRTNLIKSCSEFTGFNNELSLLDANIEPSLELLRIHTYKYAVPKRFAWWLEPIDLWQILIKKLLYKKDKFDL